MYVELTNPNHVLRPNDELTCNDNNDHGTPVNEWSGCIHITHNHIGKTIRQVEEEYGNRGFWYRCRVEDAPGPQYVELTDPNHILRPTDEMTASGNYGTNQGPDHWLGCMTAEQLIRTGETVGRNSWARCRCRVEDKPVEDKPVEWVVQDRVPVRPDVDRISWTSDCALCGHSTTENGLSAGKTHGTPHPRSSSLWLRVWCRPSDLPPKKTRVRLWLVGNIVVSSPDSPCDAAVELHLDSDGFFHEG